MRRGIGSFLLLCPILACGSHDAAGDGPAGPLAEMVEFPFDKAFGPARPLAWSVNPFDSGADCWSLATPDGTLGFHHGDGVLERRGRGPQSDPPTWQLQLNYSLGTCPKISPTADGGVVLVSSTRIVRLAADGKVLSDRALPYDERNKTFKSTLLSSGNVAVSFTTTPAAGSLDSVATVVAILDADGKETNRTPLPPVHLESADHPGVGATKDRPPGLGLPAVVAMAPTLDGGLVVTGGYDFYRYIECGSEGAPTDPTSSSCGDSNGNGLIARLDATGKILWTTRLGDGYRTNTPRLNAVAVLSDGSILAVGFLIADHPKTIDPNVQALAVRLDAEGHQVWAKSFPWGKAPGATFVQGTSFDAIAPREAGIADLVLHPPDGNPCRLVRLEASGKISQVRLLNDLGFSNVTPTTCVANAVGPDIAFVTGTPGIARYLAKIAP